MDDLDLAEQSATVKYLMMKHPFWTRTNVVLLAVFIEHLIIGLKVVIALIIPDVPKNVKNSEKRRPEFLAKAL